MMFIVSAAGEVVREVEVVSDAQMWALIVGFGLPLLIAVVQRRSFSNKMRVGIAVVSSLLAGGGTAYFAGELTGRSWVSCALVVCVTAIATYQHLWKPTGVAPKIEALTTPERR